MGKFSTHVKHDAGLGVDLVGNAPISFDMFYDHRNCMIILLKL